MNQEEKTSGSRDRRKRKKEKQLRKPVHQISEEHTEPTEKQGSNLQIPLQMFRGGSFKSNSSFRRSSGGILSNFPTLRLRASRRNVGSTSLRQEKKAARQLGVIMGAFILCWLPYIVIFIVTACCNDCLSSVIHTITIWLGYLNSTMNPIIYALCNANFRRAFRKILGQITTKSTDSSRSEFYTVKTGKAKVDSNMFA